MAALLGACNQPTAHPGPYEAEVKARQDRLAKARIGSSKIRVADGKCLDLANPVDPWVFDAARSSTSGAVVISANAAAVGMIPTTSNPQTDDWYQGRKTPKNIIFVQVFPWAYPNEPWGLWHVANPSRIAALIQTRELAPFSPWTIPADGWKAFRMGNHPSAYLDSAHISQCRDYSGLDLVSCSIISPQQDISVYFDISRRSVPTLPAIAKKLMDGINSKRGGC